ncbi:YitT family protein [Clostridium sp.]|uniref:YitT family protein n=1 Tax=Clostridium sp. TaxID=1506 RepID=UPI00399315FB
MKKLKEYGIITLGVLLVVASFELFFFPNNIASGGISGLALVLNNLFGLEPGIIMFICNAILFAIAFVFIGGSFGVKSIYAAFSLSGILSIIEKIATPNAVTNNLILASLFGSALLALGSSIIFSQGASTGGTSITAKLLNKYAHIDIGKGMFISDSVVILFAMYTFGIELGLFGLLSVYLTGNFIDKFINGAKSCKKLLIFTKKKDLVVDYITKDIDRGCTILKVEGGYTKEENDVILTILDRRQFIMLKKFMKENDPNAFITVSTANEVLGEGFASIIE